MDLFADAFEVDSATKSLVVLRHSAWGRGHLWTRSRSLLSRVSWLGLLLALVFLSCARMEAAECWDSGKGVPIRCASACESLLMSACWF